jgi:hypothetical protein
MIDGTVGEPIPVIIMLEKKRICRICIGSKPGKDQYIDKQAIKSSHFEAHFTNQLQNQIKLSN